jgi:small-conductance mechanosensitive channel
MSLGPWAETALHSVLILLAAAIAYAAIRVAVAAAGRHILDRRGQAEDALLSPLERERRIVTLQRLASRIGGVAIVIIAALMVLATFDIDIGPAVAGLGVVGVAVGFGAQTLIRDWLAGIFIVTENQYSAGDLVRIAGVEGMVEDLSLRRTTVREPDGTLHTVPNGQIIVASNLSRGRHGATTGLGFGMSGHANAASDAAEPPEPATGK